MLPFIHIYWMAMWYLRFSKNKNRLPRCLPWFSQLLISTATVEVLDLLSPSTRRCGRCTFFPCACAGRTGAGRKDMVLQATGSTTPKQTCFFFTSLGSNNLHWINMNLTESFGYSLSVTNIVHTICLGYQDKMLGNSPTVGFYNRWVRTSQRTFNSPRSTPAK